MSKDSSTRYYQRDKERIQKSLVKGIKISLKKKKTENENMVANNRKISQKLKSKNWLSIEKCIMRCETIKRLISLTLQKKKKHLTGAFSASIRICLFLSRSSLP